MTHHSEISSLSIAYSYLNILQIPHSPINKILWDKLLLSKLNS
jgi:hypothetical protein